MLNNGKISSRQLTILVVMHIIGSAILVIPSTLAVVAKQDAWISAILAVGTGVLAIKLVHALGRRFPGMNLMAYSEQILGKWLGKTVMLVFILGYPYLIASLTLYNIGDFMTAQILPETPIEAIYLVVMAVAIMGARLGLEPLARAGEIFFPVVMFLLFLLFLFVIPDGKLQNVLPVLENGIKPVISAALPFISFPFLEVVIFLMVYPLINREEQNGASLFAGVLMGGIALVVITFLSILVLGADLTARLVFPSYALAKKISVGRFLERMEVMVAIIWMVTIFFRLSFLFYVSASGLAQVLGLRDYRFLLLPMGMLMSVLALVLVPTTPALFEFIPIWGTYAPAYGILLPLLLLGVAVLRGKSKEKGAAKGGGDG